MTGWTEDDVLRFKRKHKQAGQALAAPPKFAKKPRTGKGAQQPNKTEAEFAKLYLAGQDARYQALSFHMKAGHSYTPDWIVFEDGVPVRAYEVKGSYRFHSQGRAHLAFSQCALEFQGIEFIWVTKTKEGWIRE